MSSATPGLRIVEVSHRFGPIVAADRVCLEARPGEVHCLVGPSGSGKSTLLRLVAGLERLREGRIEIGGERVADPDRHRSPEERSVGFVFQDYALFPHLNVWRNVAFGLTRGSAASVRRRGLRRAVEPWLERVGMAAYAEAMPHTLSGGQQQRVALARALAPGPKVMLLDEPFSGLDERLRDEVRSITLRLLREAGAATLMITHDPQEALRAADALSVIRDGRLLQTGPPREVYRHPVDGAVAEVLGPVNRLRVALLDGRLRTPWGPVEGPSAAGRARAAAESGVTELLIRPDALELSRPGADDGDLPRGRVVRVLPGSALQTVRIALEDGAREELPVGAAADVVELDAYAFDRDAWRVGEPAVVRWLR